MTAIHVDEGDRVQTGDVLVELDTGILQSQVEAAEATLAEATASLDKLLAGATDAEIAAAEAAVSSAQAGIAQAAGQMLETQAAIDTAEAQVESANRQYGELASHPTDAERQVARAQVAVAEAGIKQAQAAYNLVKGDPQIGALPQSRGSTRPRPRTGRAVALALTEQGANPPATAWRLRQRHRRGQGRVNAAESRGPGVEANLQAAMASVTARRLRWTNCWKAPPLRRSPWRRHAWPSAQASVQSALATLRQAQVLAPFDGQVGEINVRVGELTSPETGGRAHRRHRRHGGAYHRSARDRCGQRRSRHAGGSHL